MFKREHLLFLALGGFFICNALMAEFIGVKVFSLEGTLGLIPVEMKLFGYGPYGFDLTAGVLLWPVVFVMTDVINEYYGKKGVRLLTLLTTVLIVYAFIMVFLAIQLSPSSFWEFEEVTRKESPAFKTDNGAFTKGFFNRQLAYENIFGQGLWIIVGSLIAFLVGQFLDVTVFQALKRVTKSKKIWLRATGSTLVSQLVDSLIVIYIAFGLGKGLPVAQCLAIALVGYCYKFIVAIIMTPVIYLIHGAIDRFLGHETAERLMREAAGK